MRIASALMALALLAGCKAKEPPPPPAAATIPLTFAQASDAARVSMTLSPQIAAYPTLHQRLFIDGRRELTDFLTRAAESRAAADVPGQPSAPYTRDIRWSVTADTPRLLSLLNAWSDYTGGAHPSHGSTTLLWDKPKGQAILQSALFKDDADTAPLDAALCEAARQAKVARLGVAGASGGAWSCPGWKTSDATLVSSTIAGKIGGLTFHFDPYVLGPYAEGDYAVVVPQTAFRTALAPAYAEEFAGQPAPPRPAPAPTAPAT